MYLLAMFLVFFAVGAYFLYPVLKVEPTCQDGRQNGSEIDVDCGGGCAKICPLEVRPASVLWARAFQVIPGIYDVLGYIENQNADAGVSKLLYRFKLYDEKNVLIAERDGKGYISPNQSFAIFEHQIETGERVPKRVFLEFEDGYQWVKTDPHLTGILLSVENKELTNASSSPRLSADIYNNSLIDIHNIEVAAIIRDAEDNAIGVSQTLIGELPKKSSRTVYFTWLRPFENEVARVEILPKFDPFANY